jgi:hypothetical protein
VAVENVDLAAAISLLPTHDKGSDVTGGLGTTVYDFSQTVLDQLSRAIVNGASLTGLAQAAGIDPQSLLNTLLADVPANLLPSILASISLDLPLVGTVLDQLSGGDQALLANVLNLLGVDDITDQTLTGLLALLGLNLSDPLNLSGLAVPGVNLITTGATFGLLKMLGLDLGWTPGLPNSVANEINNTEYLKLGVDGVVNLVIGKLNTAATNGTLNLGLLDTLLGGLNLPLPGVGTTVAQAVASLVSSLAGLINPITSALPDVLDVRVVPTIGIGFGAFAAATAFQQVVADLANQPGGTNYNALTGELNPLLGSLTVLPLILINNPARPDGGAVARLGWLASLLGIDAVNPKTALTGEGGTDVLGTGLHVGGANVLPILVDATYEYQPLSDMAAWPNPVTLINNLAAALVPTYMLRGLDLGGLTDQLNGALAGIGTTPVSLNLYLTLHSATLPMLEPLYLASDFLNMVGLKPVADIVTHFANALAPALTTLVNIGYANAIQNPDGTITRDPNTAGTETPFFSFANIDYGKALSDSFTQLIGGFQKEFFSGNPTPTGPNILSNLLNALFGGSPLTGATAAVTPLAATTALPIASDPAAAAVPSANARLLSVASVDGKTSVAADVAKDVAVVKDSTTEVSTEAVDEAPVADAAAPAKGEPAAAAADTQTPAADADAVAGDATPAKDVKPPKHAKPEGDSASATGDQSTPPKHAKPDSDDGSAASDFAPDAGTKTPPKHAKPTTNETRDTANDFSLKGDKSADKPGKHGDKGGAATGSDAGTSDSGASDAGASDKAA